MEQIDKAKLLKWIDENWEMERTSGSIAGEARAIVWHEFNDKVRSGDLDVDSMPVPTLQKGDKVRHIIFNGPSGEVVKISKSGQRAYVKWPHCAPAYYKLDKLIKIQG